MTEGSFDRERSAGPTTTSVPVPPWERPLFGALLSPLGALYGFAMGVRRRAYRDRLLSAVRLPIPVISVGNLTVGGTGKTPLVSTILDLLPERLKPALVVSRGYGAQVEDHGITLNDEGWMLKNRHPEAVFVQGSDRAKVAEAAIARGTVNSVILDDGFQHLRVERSLDVLVVAVPTLLRPRRCLPAGPWREPLAAARSAGVVVLTHADRVTAAEAERAETLVRAVCPSAPILRAAHRPSRLIDVHGKSHPLETLRGKAFALVSGIAQPAAFSATVRELGAEVRRRFDFPDHHGYSPKHIEDIVSALRGVPLDGVLTTEKDLKKLLALDLPGAPLFAVAIDLSLGDGRGVLARALEGVTAVRRR